LSPNEIEQQLRSVYSEWYGLLVNPRFCRHNNLISWTAYDGGKAREPVTNEKFLNLVETRQYSFQCAEDGSLFQLLYRFDNSLHLTEARLGFYRTADPGVSEQAALVSWLRFDFDPQFSSGVLHHDCHLHIHGFPDTRIMVDGVPSPRQFVDFVLASCYPSSFEILRINEDGRYAGIEGATEEDLKTIQVGRIPRPSHLIHIGLTLP